MSANDFCNWLQGYFELANPMSIGVSETAMIREHLELANKKELKPSTDYCAAPSHSIKIC